MRGSLKVDEQFILRIVHHCEPDYLKGLATAVHDARVKPSAAEEKPSTIKIDRRVFEASFAIPFRYSKS